MTLRVPTTSSSARMPGSPSRTSTHITLDLDLFARHIAPALGVKTRFVGSEPIDELTARYNELMQEQLPQHGIEVKTVERLTEGGQAVSASRVRQALADGSLNQASALVPATTVPYLIAHLATDALRVELNTTPKPGLVDRNDNGAHTLKMLTICTKKRAAHIFFIFTANWRRCVLPKTDLTRNVSKIIL